MAGKSFEIAQWPQPGWRRLDPGTGDEVPWPPWPWPWLVMCDLVRLEPRKGTLKCNGRPDLEVLLQENLEDLIRFDDFKMCSAPIAWCFQGDFFYGKNLAIATENNQYLDGLGAL